eukprot:50543_1
MCAVLFITLYCLWLRVTKCKVAMNALFSDGLILQSNKNSGYRSFIYGTASPNELIKITGNIQGAPYSVNANNNGSWTIEINPSTSNTNRTITVNGTNNTIKINDVTMGDVFLCIGATNMIYPMSDIYNSSYYIQSSLKYPSIKIATIPTINANQPQNMFLSSNIKWTQANPNTLPSFSSICYLSAQKLLQMYGDKRNMGL